MGWYLLLFAIGLCGGLLAGMIGVGGGVVYILVLPYLLTEMGVNDQEIVQYTIANSLIGTLFASLSGNVTLIIQKQFFWKETLLLGLPAALCSLLALNVIVNTPGYQKEQFNLIIILLSAFIIFRTTYSVYQSQDKLAEKKVKPWYIGITGALAGMASAVSGMGGGVIVIPVLNLWFKMTMKKTRSISLGVICIVSATVTLINIMEKPQSVVNQPSAGFVVLPLALVLSLGVMIASPFGVKLSQKLSNRTISYIFVAFMTVIIIEKAAHFL